MTQTILTLAIAYAAVAALAVFLTLSGPVSRILKGTLTIVIAVLLFTTYRGIGELRGLPSDAAPPDDFLLHWALVSEPNHLEGDRGSIFLWLVEMDADNYPIGLPRAYKLPYSLDLAVKVAEAQRQISLGEQIAGSFEDGAEEPSPFDGSLLPPEQEQTGTGSVLGDRQTFVDIGSLTLGIAPAPVTPQKQN